MSALSDMTLHVAVEVNRLNFSSYSTERRTINQSMGTNKRNASSNIN